MKNVKLARNVKKAACALLACTMLFAASGCGKAADTETEKETDQVTKENSDADTEDEAAEADTETEAPEKEVRYAPYFTDAPFEASGVVWIAADSIASPHDDNEYEVPISGWGEYLADYMTEDAVVYNEARSGRSSKSYRSESNYKTIISQMAYGDYLLIGFGLNDEKEDMPKLYTDPNGDADTEESFEWYLKTYYIEPALEVGAEPVLLSPVMRATYEDGKLTEQTQLPYVKAMENLIDEYAEQGITLYYIDLYEMTGEWYDELDEEGVMALHGVDNEGKADTTHFSAEGAKQLAEKIAEEIKAQQMELEVYMK